eukprot:GEMP01019107.1.p1 GENE.GEMP01019107.1~~GEMP01019107.1.p1  ORF type:complete len:720 (+),score=122.74 GEMP01019107.1:122-2281(+)
MDPNSSGYGKLQNGILGDAPQAACKREYDIALIFPHKTDAGVKFGDHDNQSTKLLKEPRAVDLDKMNQWESKRNAMTHSLLNSGLLLNAFYNQDRTMVICKIGVDIEKLKELAEQQKHEIQLKDEYLGAYAVFKRDYQDANNERFMYSHLYRQHGDEENPGPVDMFRTVDRLHLLDHAVRSYAKGCAGLDIGSALSNKEVAAYFPLHESSERQFMSEHFWNCFMPWGTDISKVRDYFGEKIAFYFLWMTYWIFWLFGMGVLGLVVTVLDLLEHTPNTFVLLPLGIVVSLCNALFVHFWRRYCATYAMQWGTLGMKDEFEPSRKEFRTDIKRMNPVTERVDYYYPWEKRVRQIALNYTLIGGVMLVLGFLIACMFWLRHFMHMQGLAGARIGFMILNAMFVEITNYLFDKVAEMITGWENHRTDREHETHLMAKTVVFKFFNSYVSLFYIAFIKSKYSLFGTKMTCMNDDCLIDLECQLGIFLFFRLIISNLCESCAPKILWLYRTWRAQLRTLTCREQIEFFTSDTPRIGMSVVETEYHFEQYEASSDLDEMLITYGYTNLFVVACPWAPAFVLVANLLEIYLDGDLLLDNLQRPFPVRVRDQEPWDTAFDIFSLIAMLSNLAVVIFASKELVDWSLTEKLVLFILLEHIILIIRIALKAYYPAIPAEVRVLRLKHDHLVRKYLDHVEVEDDDLKRMSATRNYHDHFVIADRDEDDELE